MATRQEGVVSARGPHDTGPTFTFSTKRGGNQGGEGNDAGGEWFIEGVKAELDAPNEWYWDERAERLYYLPNATGTGVALAAPPADGDVAVWVGKSTGEPLYKKHLICFICFLQRKSYLFLPTQVAVPTLDVLFDLRGCKLGSRFCGENGGFRGSSRPVGQRTAF